MPHERLEPPSLICLLAAAFLQASKLPTGRPTSMTLFAQQRVIVFVNVLPLVLILVASEEVSHTHTRVVQQAHPSAGKRWRVARSSA